MVMSFNTTIIIIMTLSWYHWLFLSLVTHLIRKYYIHVHISQGKKVWVMLPSLTLHFPSCTKGEKACKEVNCFATSQYSRCHNITARWKVRGCMCMSCVCFQTGFRGQSRKGANRVKEERRGVVCEMQRHEFSVKWNELGLCTAWYSLWGLLLLRWLLLRATRRGNLKEKWSGAYSKWHTLYCIKQ